MHAIDLSAPAFGLPRLVALADERAQRRFLAFFSVTISSPHTRRAYARAASDLLTWCEMHGVVSIASVQPLHVAAWVEQIGREVSVATVKLRVAGVRHLFDWLVTGDVLPVNPTTSTHSPSHRVRRGKTRVLATDEAQRLLDAIDVGAPAGLRDRALIGLMIYSFARVGAALAMRVDDVFVQNHRLWVRLHEKGGKRHEMPCDRDLEEYLAAYIDGCELRDDRNGPLFRTIARGTRRLSNTPLPRANAYQMIRRRAVAADITTAIGSHSLLGTGITAYLKNGGTLRDAAAIANHASTRTTHFYDHRPDNATLDEVAGADRANRHAA